MVACYRAKGGAYHVCLAMKDGVPVAYGAHAAAPNRVGMIEDLFTLQSARRRGIATAVIAAFLPTVCAPTAANPSSLAHSPPDSPNICTRA